MHRARRLCYEGGVNVLAIGIPALFYLLVIALVVYLHMRGVKAGFLKLLAAGALLYLLQSGGYFALMRMQGGMAAHASWLKWFTLVAVIATAIWSAAFLGLAAHLLRAPGKGR